MPLAGLIGAFESEQSVTCESAQDLNTLSSSSSPSQLDSLILSGSESTSSLHNPTILNSYSAGPSHRPRTASNTQHHQHSTATTTISAADSASSERERVLRAYQHVRQPQSVTGPPGVQALRTGYLPLPSAPVINAPLVSAAAAQGVVAAARATQSRISK